MSEAGADDFGQGGPGQQQEAADCVAGSGAGAKLYLNGFVYCRLKLKVYKSGGTWGTKGNFLETCTGEKYVIWETHISSQR